MKLAFLKTRLGRQIIAWVLLANACLSLFAAGVQLGFSYERGKREVLQEFNVIEHSFQDGLQTALWYFNFEQVDVLLDGIFAQPDLLYLALNATTQQSWQRGDANADSDAEQTFSLYHETADGTRQHVGTLLTRISYENLRKRVWDQLATLVLSNFMKTLVASILMLSLFDYFVSRHLRSITSQIGQTSWLTGTANIALHRPVHDVPDEIDHIAAALNLASSEIRDAYDTLSDANREQSEFTYAISHDLKSPTNTVGMLLDELEFGEKQNLTPDGQQLLLDAKYTTRRMGRLIEDVMSYSKTVGDDPVFEEINIESTISEVLTDLAGEITNSQASIMVSEMPSIMGIPLQIRLLFQKLISNAIKFSAPDRKPEVSISASETGSGDIVRIEVQDNGIGIDPVHHDRVFGMFQRLHTERQYPGSGLGLTLCRRIVSNHGGKIELTSKIGEGATVALLLPREGRLA